MENTLLHGPYSEHVDKDCWRSHERPKPGVNDCHLGSCTVHFEPSFLDIMSTQKCTRTHRGDT